TAGGAGQERERLVVVVRDAVADVALDARALNVDGVQNDAGALESLGHGLKGSQRRGAAVAAVAVDGRAFHEPHAARDQFGVLVLLVLLLGAAPVDDTAVE